MSAGCSTERDATMGQGGDDGMSVGFVLGWDVSTSTELSWDGVVVGAGELGHGAAAVG